MYRIIWDKKTGGVLLKRHFSKETLSVFPRPVFYEELDLLKLKEMGWKYPECDEPLLWACNKQYFYRGEYVFEVKGANVYDAPTVVFAEGKEKLKLKSADVVENVVGKAHDDVETPSDVVENVVENKDNVVENILESISKDPSISTKELAGTYSLSERQVQRIMTRLKDKGIIRRVGPDKGGHWEIIK